MATIKKKITKKLTSDLTSDFEILKKTLLILLIPILLLGLNIISGGILPKPIIYGTALIIGFFAFIKSFEDPELIIAAFIFYLPMAKEIKIDLAPMVNGTNIFFFLLMMALFLSKKETNTKLQYPPLHKYVTWYAVISSLSVFTTLVFIPNGLDYFRDDVFYDYKAWVDQFILYFLIFKSINNKGLARRIFVYMAVGSILLELYTAQEMLDKMGRSSIEKSRVNGPLHQPNDLGAFIVYTSSILSAILIVNIKNVKAWLLAPYFLFLLKLLLSTFSRGAYLGFAAVALISSYVKGKKFLISIATIAILAVFLFPELVPNSLRSRMSQTSHNDGLEETMDKSSEHRIILWHAAIQMTAESPLIGKGFKGFPHYKSDYTEFPVRESDTHNMYLYISSQMGIPALVLFLMILAKLFFDGRFLYVNSKNSIEKMIGLSASSMSAGIVIINIFGSRMINIEVCGYVWIMIAIINVLNQKDHQKSPTPRKGLKKINDNN